MANSCQLLARHKAVLARDFFKRHMRHTRRTASDHGKVCGIGDQKAYETGRAFQASGPSSCRNVKAVSLGQADWLKITPQK
jgi:hypothetical protein